MGILLKTKIPGPKSQALMVERKRQVARGPFHATPIFISKAKGEWLEDVDGNQLLDFASGIGVTALGHCPEALVSAIQAQSTRFLHAGFNVTPYESYLKLCEKLNQNTPGSFEKKSFLVNTGAEAVENAIKIARAFTGRPAVVCFDHAFHGRTYMAMTLTSKVKPYKTAMAPFCPEVYRAPFPYTYRWPHVSGLTADETLEQVSRECFEQFKDLIQNQIGASQVAAVILEPVLGEGGFVPAPKLFLKKLREFCTQYGVVLIADEIQSGLGRTGHFFACQDLELVPDLITTAKGLGGGLPISAVTGRAEIMDAPMEGAIGGTFNGNPLACAAALAVIESLETSKVLENARRLGATLTSALRSIQEKSPYIGDVRGLGPMQAMEFVKNRTTKEPDPERAKAVIKYCYENGVILMTAGTYGNVVRFLVPLELSPESLKEGLRVVESAVGAL